MKSLIFKSFVVAACTALVGFLGCTSNNPVSPGDDGDQQISKTAKSASNSSVRVYQNLASFKEMDDLIGGPNAIVDLEVPEMKNPESAVSFARNIKQKTWTRLQLSDKPGLEVRSASDDSVIWDVQFEENGITYRSKLTYNRDADKARFFIAGVEFPDSSPIAYDSVHVVAKLNGTLLDDSDDVLEQLDYLKRYKAGQLINEEEASFVPDAYPAGTEPTGGVLTSDITYSNTSFIQNTSARLEYHEGQGGSYSKESRFSDGSTSREQATFNVDGTGTFLEERRDGTRIEGEFDSAEHDGQGSFRLTTTFPADHDPASVVESGSFQVDLADDTISGTFEREVTRKDGSKEREKVRVSQHRTGDVLSTTLEIEETTDGSRGFINITETPELEDIRGEWINADETFVTFSAQAYSDDSAHLEGKIYASEADFQNGADPIATFVFDFYPDGSGRGVVTEGDKTYDVTIRPDGTVEIKERT